MSIENVEGRGDNEYSDRGSILEDMIDVKDMEEMTNEDTWISTELA